MSTLTLVLALQVSVILEVSLLLGVGAQWVYPFCISNTLHNSWDGKKKKDQLLVKLHQVTGMEPDILGSSVKYTTSSRHRPLLLP